MYNNWGLFLWIWFHWNCIFIGWMGSMWCLAKLFLGWTLLELWRYVCFWWSKYKIYMLKIMNQVTVISTWCIHICNMMVTGAICVICNNYDNCNFHMVTTKLLKNLWGLNCSSCEVSPFLLMQLLAIYINTADIFDLVDWWRIVLGYLFKLSS